MIWNLSVSLGGWFVGDSTPATLAWRMICKRLRMVSLLIWISGVSNGILLIGWDLQEHYGLTASTLSLYPGTRHRYSLYCAWRRLLADVSWSLAYIYVFSWKYIGLMHHVSRVSLVSPIKLIGSESIRFHTQIDECLLCTLPYLPTLGSLVSPCLSSF